jgi:AraC family transcriptional regulator
MVATTVLCTGPVSVIGYCCTAGSMTTPYTEHHTCYSVSYVRTGSFGYVTRGMSYDMVAGSVLVGRLGDDFVCTHDHHLGGDQCLSIQFSDAWMESNSSAKQRWSSRAFPPLPELMVLGELAQSSAEGHNDIAVDEAALFFTARFLGVTSSDRNRESRIRARDKKLAIETALWLSDNASTELNLDRIASMVALSPFHFLRLFTRVIGVTPHQYLVRSRLRNAARLLIDRDRSITDIAYKVGFTDLSNFTRTFRRASGVSPRQFRHAAASDRKNLQVLLGGLCL